MLLEVCVDKLVSAINAVHNGADELEVCSDLTNGGLTPSFELVKEIICMISEYNVTSKVPTKNVKVNVMIRSNTGWDFRFSNHEMEQMVNDVAHFKELNVDSFVFGALTDNSEIDQEACKRIINVAAPKPVTFHRAFDVCSDPFDAINKIVELGFKRLLTSGHKESADNPEAISLINTLIKSYSKQIEIMPGAGINIHNAKIFLDMGCKIIHGTFKNGNDYITDGGTVKNVKKLIG